VKCVDAAEVTRLYAGLLSEARARALTVHFRECVACAALDHDVATTTARLRHEPDELADEECVAEVMALIRMGKAEPPAVIVRPFWRSWQAWLLVPATAAATAAIMLVFWPRAVVDDSAGFTARGTSAPSLDRFVSLGIFRKAAGGFIPVGDTIRADDTLAFTYQNRASVGTRYLMVLAVDDGGHIFWYYPPRAEPDHEAPSLPIAGNGEPTELPEEITQELVPGPLRFFGLFSTKPLSVRDVEAAVALDLARAGGVTHLERLTISEAGAYSLLVRVEPAAAEPR